MTDAFINRIATALPPHDVHEGFLDFGRRMLREEPRRLALFNRMAERSGISHRYSIFEPEGEGDVAHFYIPGAFPGTGERMQLFENFAPDLATAAAERLLAGEDRSRISHLIITCCTGFFAPGIDLQFYGFSVIYVVLAVTSWWLLRRVDHDSVQARRGSTGHLPAAS